MLKSFKIFALLITFAVVANTIAVSTSARTTPGALFLAKEYVSEDGSDTQPASEKERNPWQTRRVVYQFQAR